MTNSKSQYTDESIKTLDPLEHIRLRTGMYIGRIGDGSHPSDGIYVLLKEIIDNSVDEFIMKIGKKIEIQRTENSISVRDYGRGIPLGKVIDCVSQMNTGGKYNTDVFQFSVGMNGVGTKAVNALSETFEVTSYREGQFSNASFSKGKILNQNQGKIKNTPDGTFIKFTPDFEIFKKYQWRDEFIVKRLQYYAYLNAGLEICFNGQSFISKNGLQDLLEAELGQELQHYDPLYHKEDRLEFCFTHTGNYGENYFSFVNGQYTNDGGTHQSAFREGILKGVNEFYKSDFAGEDIREGIIGAVCIKIQDPVFESQTKNKLGSTDVRSWLAPLVKKAVEKWLHTNPQNASKLLEKIKTNEKIRTELSKFKKEAKDRAKQVNLRIPKLRDCKVHFNQKQETRHEESSLFLCEGDSAGGSIVQTRDCETQAVFPLKGKPLNCFGMGRETVYKNEELYNLMCSLGTENGIENLRYNKIIIATDADVDGLHIRNLLLTFFLSFFNDLFTKNHIFILETPLFRVRNKNKTIYCYSEKEKEMAITELRNHEITRFKGLGEISPSEFGQFIGSEMRVVPVSVQDAGNTEETLKFLMGKNTDERRNYIVDNLINDLG